MTVLTSSDHVIVVGAGLAGFRFIEASRREGYEGAITLVGDEIFAPYDRPPLSKQILVGKWSEDRNALTDLESLEALRVDVRLGSAATGLDLDTATVHLADGRSVTGTHVVIATGTRARLLPFTASESLRTLRTRDDATRLLVDVAALEPASPVVIIGGGFIGAEVATALHTRGLHPIVLEAGWRPLLHVLGSDVSEWLMALPKALGIDLRCDQKIHDVVRASDEGPLRVLFDDDEPLEAPVVVLGVGAQVNVEWLADSGLVIENGVVVDEHLLATPRVAAIGDVARFAWRNVTGVEQVRIEHWELANQHALRLAQYWTLGTTPAELLVPYFWSDQYGKKLQMLGHAAPDDDVAMVKGSVDQGAWVAIYSRAGTVTGVVALAQPRALVLSKQFLESLTTIERALELAPWDS